MPELSGRDQQDVVSESDISDCYVTPAVTKAGLATTQWRRECGFTDGKIGVCGSSKQRWPG